MHDVCAWRSSTTVLAPPGICGAVAVPTVLFYFGGQEPLVLSRSSVRSPLPLTRGEHRGVCHTFRAQRGRLWRRLVVYATPSTARMHFSTSAEEPSWRTGEMSWRSAGEVLGVSFWGFDTARSLNAAAAWNAAPVCTGPLDHPSERYLSSPVSWAVLVGAEAFARRAGNVCLPAEIWQLILSFVPSSDASNAYPRHISITRQNGTPCCRPLTTTSYPRCLAEWGGDKTLQCMLATLLSDCIHHGAISTRVTTAMHQVRCGIRGSTYVIHVTERATGTTRSMAMSESHPPRFAVGTTGIQAHKIFQYSALYPPVAARFGLSAHDFGPDNAVYTHRSMFAQLGAASLAHFLRLAPRSPLISLFTRPEIAAFFPGTQAAYDANSSLLRAEQEQKLLWGTYYPCV